MQFGKEFGDRANAVSDLRCGRSDAAISHTLEVTSSMRSKHRGLVSLFSDMHNCPTGKLARPANCSFEVQISELTLFRAGSAQ